MGTRRGNAVLLLQLLLRVRSWPKAGCCAETTLQTMLAEQLWAGPAGPDRLSLPGSLWVSAENSTGPARLLSCPPGSSCSARLDSAVLYSLGHKLVTTLFIAQRAPFLMKFQRCRKTLETSETYDYEKNSWHFCWHCSWHVDLRKDNNLCSIWYLTRKM